jgi:ABC-type multidrug transport system fused ATPase/permease subunit
MTTQPISQLLTRLWHHLSHRRRIQFALLLVLMIIASFAEILSIGAVLPFLAILTDPARVFTHSSAKPIIEILGLTEPNQLLLPWTIAFGIAVLIAGFMRLVLLWASTKLSFAAGAELSINIYRRTLYQPYSVHVARNSTEIIGGISNKTTNTIYIINMVIGSIGSSVILIAILIAILLIEPVVALAAFGGFGLIYATIIQLTRKRLLVNSQINSRESINVIKSLQEGLGGIRDVLIDGSQATYCKIYRDADLRMRLAQGSSSFISGSPRFGVEALGMLLIAALAYYLAVQADGISKTIPVLGALALGAQRFLPVLQQLYASWSQIQGGLASLQDTLELLDQPIPDYADNPPPEPLPFLQHISLKQLSFRYSPKTPQILKSLNLKINKGSRVGFIGVTGSGKSTLLDVVMGLLQPTSGTVEIDDQPIVLGNQRAWQAHIAHVPQAIFLADSTIEENIAFGVPVDQIDSKRARQAAQQAQIADVIETWPNQYQTFVGERGIRLSGGQRQRIGIARALYKQADVIIFDEATSALDNQTEEAVMKALEGLSKDLTLLIIAHRLSTLKNCTKIVELSGGVIERIGTYQEVVDQAQQGHQNGTNESSLEKLKV